MKIKVDTHTHTLVSGHAYSTLCENAAVAAKAGLEAFGMTEHAPAIPGAPQRIYFMNFHVIDRELYGVRVLRGIELNILGFDGRTDDDIDDYIFKRLDYAIASFHNMIFPEGTREENTRAYLGAMNNPNVKIIGHPDDGHIPVDMEQLVLAAKATDTLLEVNNASLKSAFFRLNTRENIIEMLRLCEKHAVAITTGSDAHFSTAVGEFSNTLSVLEETGFPEELVASRSIAAFEQAIGRKKA